MVEEITKLESPIDVMMLIHKAFRAHSTRGEMLAAKLEEGGDLQAFKQAFDFWGKALGYHAIAEDKYMTAPLTNCQPARDNEAEHAELAGQAGELQTFIEKGDAAGLTESVKTAMMGSEGEQHKELAAKLEDVEKALKKEIGETRVIGRTRRHLFRKVMDLRVTEYDHFENEEAFVCSLVRERMNEQEQLDIVKHLLIDEAAEDPRWIIDWVAREVSQTERLLLSDLEKRFGGIPTKAV